MAINVEKCVSAYLALWKLLDVYFPGHELTEIREESPEIVMAEVSKLLEDDLNWSEDPEQLRKEITLTIAMARDSQKDQQWRTNALLVKNAHQENAFRFAMQLPDAATRFNIAGA